MSDQRLPLLSFDYECFPPEEQDLPVYRKSRPAGFMLRMLHPRRLAPRVQTQRRKQRLEIRSQWKEIYGFRSKA